MARLLVRYLAQVSALARWAGSRPALVAALLRLPATRVAPPARTAWAWARTKASAAGSPSAWNDQAAAVRTASFAVTIQRPGSVYVRYHGTFVIQARQTNGSRAPCGRDPIIAESARKHGVSDEDILQAYANPIRVFALYEGFTMVIGANLAAIIYEIGVVDGVSAAVIVHAMRAREKFLR